jgi:hypothetical protein
MERSISRANAKAARAAPPFTARAQSTENMIEEIAD